MLPPYPTTLADRKSHAYPEWAFFITLLGLALVDPNDSRRVSPAGAA
jgi:hypothetical protein